MTMNINRRQMKVLRLAAQGHTLTYMAEQLGCSPNNIVYHLAQLYRKFDLERHPGSLGQRVLLIVRAIHEGYLTTDDILREVDAHGERARAS